MTDLTPCVICVTRSDVIVAGGEPEKESCSR